MEIKKLPFDFTVCKSDSVDNLDCFKEFSFAAVTDEEISLVCKTENVPEHTSFREDGWKGFRIEGELDFSLIGVLSGISTILAENKIGIFVVSTYNTDYIFVKSPDFEKAASVLEKGGYSVI